jgi:PAS domain S-box-containing protein
MTGELEKQLTTLKHGDHICSIYENTAEQMSVSVPFIIDGLARSERCIYIIDDSTIEEVVRELSTAGVDVAHERQRGALWLLTPLDTYLRAGAFVPEAMLDWIRQAETEAIADGFSGLRLTAEPTWSFGPEPGCDRLIEYEVLLNQLPTYSKSVILCQYHQSRFGMPCIHDVLRTHPVAILGDQVCPNPYYEPPELVLSPEPQASAEYKRKRVAWWIGQFKRARVAEQERERAKTAQLESEGRFREIVDLIPAAVYVCDKYGIIQQFNRRAVELWGRAPRLDEDVRFCGAIRHFRTDGTAIPRDELPIVETARNGTPVRNMELVIERADGSRVVVMVNIAPIRNAEGTPVGAINCFLDVTERRQAEEQLRQSERRLAEAQQVAHIGSWERDLRTNEVTWSDELYRLFGLQPHDVNLSYQQFLNLIFPEDAKRIPALVDEAIRQGHPFNFDYRITLQDGSVHVLNDRGSVILNEEGEPIRLVGTCQDVSELQQAEQELTRQKVILQTIFDHIPVMINFVDAAGRVQMVNKHWERVLGWSLKEAQTRDLLAECYPDPESRASVREYIQHPPPGWTDFKMRVRDGRTLDTSWNLIALADGTRIGFGQDVTERKQAEKESREHSESVQALSRRLLEVQEEERRHLARELHDEFGQILATITLHLHAARRLAGDAALPRLDQCATLLQQAGERVRNLALELRPTMLETLGLEATLRWLAENHLRTGCEVQVVGHLSGVPLDPKMAIACFRVAQEAMTNVVRHAAAEHVWIELSQSESMLELVVRDDGVGFDVAATGELAARRGSLGLMGMRERVQLFGGILQVYSEPGLGTRIHASFPLSDALDPATDPEK